MTLVTVRRQVTLPATPEELWPVAADSDLGNRLGKGMYPVKVEPFEGRGPERFLAVGRLSFFKPVYEEAPAEFIQNEWLRIVRKCRSGPIKHVEVELKLAPGAMPGTSDIELRISVEPRNFLFILLAKIDIAKSVRFLIGLFQARAENRMHELEPRNAPVDRALLERIQKELTERVGAGRAPLAERLLRHIADAPDTELTRLRPFALADAWGVDRDELLGVCLQASIAGALELRWDTVCPSCRTGSAEIPRLSDLGAEGHCQMCDLSFGLDLDLAVEAIFRPPPHLRDVPVGPFCLVSPARFPHVLSQTHLHPGVPLALRVPVQPGRYRFFVRGGALASLIVSTEAPEAGEVTISADTPLPGQLEVAPGGTLTVHSQLDHSVHVKVERLGDIDQAATAHRVLVHADFRRYFSTDLLRPGLALAVARVALVFTDLTGSTAMYAQLGEPVAFRIVLDHFELLRRIIEGNKGTIVKTIGDAVMAAFPDEVDAAKASLAAIDAFPTFAAKHPAAEGLALKVGIFSGACYAVSANGVLDYFGQSVNTAARVQGEASSGELVMPAALASRVTAAGALTPERCSAPFEKSLRGLAGPLTLVRIAARVAAGEKVDAERAAG